MLKYNVRMLTPCVYRGNPTVDFEKYMHFLIQFPFWTSIQILKLNLTIDWIESFFKKTYFEYDVLLFPEAAALASRAALDPNPLV